jgi:predicted lipoprotein with Yx(FWY)xxD motif
MNRTRLSLAVVVVVVAAVVAVIVSTAGGSTSRAHPAIAANSSISVEQTSFGKALADANGRTLYLFARDKPTASTSAAAGRPFWPPFTSTTRPSATGGALAREIGTANGGTHVTYNGHPLYYFVGDRHAGQTAGQGLNEFGARWYVLSTAGVAITSAPKSSPPSSSTGGGSAYGY